MGTISSTLKMVDGFTSVIQREINMMNRMVDTMEMVNRAGNMPGLDGMFDELRSDVSIANHELELFHQNMHESGNAAVNAASKASSGFGAISKAIIVANQGIQLLKQGYQSLQNFMEGADERTSADARLSIIRDELRTQEQLEAQVMAVANATRTSYETTAELVAKMGRQDYFKGQNDKALAFAQTLNQGLVVSGASAAEANSAILQLSQGIASGVLRGEEFNSIMENGSVLAEMMATSLSVTKGELRAMAQEGQLTTDIVVASIMQQSGVIEEQFNSMPATFGQVQTQMSNLWSQMLNDMSQAGQPIDMVIVKMQELYAWLDTLEGRQFMTGLATGIGFAVEGAVRLAQIIGDLYLFFSDNWTTVEPILWGIGTAIAAVTVAQWALNAAMLANPLTWVIIVIIAVIAAFVALGVAIYRAWQNNIDFKVGVIQVWNGLLNFFDQVPIFFQWVGNGVLDAFSFMASGTALILQSMVNDAIAKINALISFANQIPGVSIEAIASVEFGTQFAIAEEAKRQQRAADLQSSRDAAGIKAAERENQLTQDAARWRIEAAEKETALQEKHNKINVANVPFGSDLNWGGGGVGGMGAMPVKGGGGSLDKVGKIEQAIDISNQSLAYLRDIAELQALESVNAYSTVTYDLMGEARLSDADANLLKSSSNFNTNVYYLNYSGGVRINNDIKKGEDWNSVRRQMEDEIDNDIERGLSDLDRVVHGF